LFEFFQFDPQLVIFLAAGLDKRCLFFQFFRLLLIDDDLIFQLLL